MTTETQHKLEQVRNHLRQLGNGVANLVQNHTHILENSDIEEYLKEFREAYDFSVSRLKKPNFTIATLGTTSSGKSTIVNALIGRKIAPIEATEMSGGVLTIKHSQEFKVSVAKTEGAHWETGTWENLNDSEIYHRIREGVMFPYHQARKKQEIIAPKVTAYVPILPAEDLHLLGLPEGIGIEFIDLPGLKSIQDRDNLKVIQKQVNKAFSLVTLDYLQVDDKHRQSLLNELKQVVKYSQGRTDSMIFILNRVDQKGQDDIDIAKRIEQLKSEIQKELNLSKLPDIIPLSGRFLYYGQCAWGATAISNNYPIDAATRRKNLDGMFIDCTSLIASHTRENKELRRWFRNIEDCLDDQQDIDDETMRKLLYHVYDWSGGDRLWQCMRDRVRDSLSELVILPALYDVFEHYDTLIDAINTYKGIKKIKKENELKNKEQQIIAASQRLAREVENIHDYFQRKIEIIIEILKKGELSDRSRLAQLGIDSFDDLYDSVREIETDLIDKLIFPVRYAFEQNKGIYELEEELMEVVTPPKARAIAKAYDLVNRKLSKFDKDNSGYFTRKVRQDSQEEIRSLEHAEKAVLYLYSVMRQAISARAQFTLQGQIKQFETGLLSLVTAVTKQLKSVCQQELRELNLDQAIISYFAIHISQNYPEIPEELFDFSLDINNNQSSNLEVIGQSEKQERYKEGGCCGKEKTRTVTKNVYDHIEYQELKMPNYQNMARQWAEGILQEEQKLWDVTSDWINDYLGTVIKEFNYAINKVMKSTERAFEQQLKSIERDTVKQEIYWENFDKELNSIKEVKQQLEQESISI